jgi:hypothetical protein
LSAFALCHAVPGIFWICAKVARKPGKRAEFVFLWWIYVLDNNASFKFEPVRFVIRLEFFNSLCARLKAVMMHRKVLNLVQY